VTIADLPFRCAGGTPAAISLGPIMPINERSTVDAVYATTEIPIAPLPGSLAHTHAGRCVPHRANHRRRRQNEIPIALAAQPTPNFPRLRALALLGRRPSEREKPIVIPAS
jgi:hypothetical protein